MENYSWAVSVRLGLIASFFPFTFVFSVFSFIYNTFISYFQVLVAFYLLFHGQELATHHDKNLYESSWSLPHFVSTVQFKNMKTLICTHCFSFAPLFFARSVTFMNHMCCTTLKNASTPPKEKYLVTRSNLIVFIHHQQYAGPVIMSGFCSEWNVLTDLLASEISGRWSCLKRVLKAKHWTLFSVKHNLEILTFTAFLGSCFQIFVVHWRTLFLKSDEQSQLQHYANNSNNSSI